MANKQKLREILDILSPYGTAVDFKAFDESVDNLKKGLKEKVQAKTLEDMQGQLARFKKNIDMEPLMAAIKDLNKNFDTRIKEVATALANEVSRFDELSKSEREETGSKVAESSGTVDSLRKELAALKTQKDTEIAELRASISSFPKDESPARFAEVYARLDQMALDEANKPDTISPVRKEIQTVRSELISKMQSGHGDHANRNIAINGNTSVLSRYTDINLKAGANTTIVYTYNNTTKYTDVTITGSGVGASVEVPTGSVNGVNSVFTVISTPIYLSIDGTNKFSPTNYTYAASVITIVDGAPPTLEIHSFHA